MIPGTKWLAAAMVATSMVGAIAGEDHEASKDRKSSYPVLSGIGVALAITDAGPEIAMVLPGSVAEKSGGLNKGDRIRSVREGDRAIPVKGKSLGEVVSLIRGPVGTTVTLEIVPENHGEGRLVALQREAVPVPELTRLRTYDELIGKPSPRAQFSALGRTSKVELSDFAGKIVVVDFWASWCGTCYAPVDKMQGLAKAHPEWKGRVVLLTVTVDTDHQAAADVIKARRWKETTHLALSPEDLDSLGIPVVPAVFIVSADGKIAAAGDPHSLSIEADVGKLLAGEEGVQR
jgi:thiol-disulfide isomerase/thioredoxin